MAKAYECDLCGKLVRTARKIDGVNFKIGERKDEFTGTHDKIKEVREICTPCYEKIMETVMDIYRTATTEE